MDGLDEQKIAEVVQDFYCHVRTDEQLGPAFSVIDDWDEHLGRLTDFWSSVTLMTGRYKGNPLAIHLVQADRFRPEMFERWLLLWKASTERFLGPTQALLLQAKAARVAAKFQSVMFMPLPEPSHPPLGLRPYRTTREFTHDDVPMALMRERRLAENTWAFLRVSNGQILCHTGPTARMVEAGSATVVHPGETYRFEIVGEVSFTLEFYVQDPSTHNS